MLSAYLKRIFDVTKHGDAREESYYSGLEELINNCAESSGKKQTHVTTLPKKTEAGNPDFRIWDGQHSIIGYIEAKTYLKATPVAGDGAGARRVAEKAAAIC